MNGHKRLAVILITCPEAEKTRTGNGKLELMLSWEIEKTLKRKTGKIY